MWAEIRYAIRRTCCPSLIISTFFLDIFVAFAFVYANVCLGRFSYQNFLLYFFTLCYSVFSLIPPQLFGLELFLFCRHRFLILLAFRVLIRLMFLLRCFFLLLLSSMFLVWCRFHGVCDKNRVFVGDKP